jgi:hypothetical protein
MPTGSFSARPVTRTLPTTPTTVRKWLLAPGPFVNSSGESGRHIRLPIGSWPFQNRPARRSSMIMTGCEEGVSDAVNRRPCFSGMPIVWK